MNDNDLALLSVEIRALLMFLSKLSMRDLEKRLATSGSGLTALQFGVMRVLCTHRHTLSELGRKMMLTPATLLPVIDTLESGGLIRRDQDPTDRRRTPITLTEKGHQALELLNQIDLDEFLIEGLQKMDPPKRETLRNLMRELAVHITGEDTILQHIDTLIQRHRNRHELHVDREEDLRHHTHLQHRERIRGHRRNRRIGERAGARMRWVHRPRQDKSRDTER